MCIRAIEIDPWALEHVPDYFKTQQMCERAVEDKPYILKFVLDHSKTHTMCERAVENKTQEIYDKTIKDDSSSLQYLPNWFVKREGLDM